MATYKLLGTNYYAVNCNRQQAIEHAKHKGCDVLELVNTVDVPKIFSNCLLRESDISSFKYDRGLIKY